MPPTEMKLGQPGSLGVWLPLGVKCTPKNAPCIDELGALELGAFNELGVLHEQRMHFPRRCTHGPRKRCPLPGALVQARADVNIYCRSCISQLPMTSHKIPRYSASSNGSSLAACSEALRLSPDSFHSGRPTPAPA